MSFEYELRCPQCGHTQTGVRSPDFGVYFDAGTGELSEVDAEGPSETEAPNEVPCPNGCGSLAPADMSADEAALLRQWRDGGYAVRSYRFRGAVVIAVGKARSLDAVLFVAEGATHEQALKTAREYMSAVLIPKVPDLSVEDLTAKGFDLQWGVPSESNGAHMLWPWKQGQLASSAPFRGTPQQCLARARDTLL